MSLLMDSTTTLVLNPNSPSSSSPPQSSSKESSPSLANNNNNNNNFFIFHSNSLQKQAKMPREFVWPSCDLARSSQEPEELKEPVIDLGGFMRGDESAISGTARLVKEACVKHGFFQVTNHGVEPSLIRAAYDGFDSIFKLPITKKLSARRQPGGISGYSGAHADRYTSKLPWKETFSFHHRSHHSNSHEIIDFFKSALGQDFENTGWVYQKYCEAMKELSLVIMELLGISLGVDRLHYRKFFEDGGSIMRCNYYPPCNSSSLTLGTGPHSDPTSLTILHQDQVGGLEVFSDNKWLAVRPRPDAFVINLGDTFMALSNGRYKSCLHRALVNREKERRSLVYFVSPREDKTVKPPLEILLEATRNYPDFTWSDLFEFTQKHYRADVATLQSFILWLRSPNHHHQSSTTTTSTSSSTISNYN